MRAFLTTALFLLCALVCAPTFAQFSESERITSFESVITIHDDSSMTVTETITVNVQGNQIKRGIFRDFPTLYRDRAGNRIRVGFTVREVLRNGTRENYSLETLTNGKRVRIGNADVFLQHGPHTYTITYDTNRQLGYFETYDELYWNVTGNGWDFPIDKAVAKVYLPGDAPLTQTTVYTGPEGSNGRDANTYEIVAPVTFETTRVLQPGEGLTIAVAWPKGFVTQPTNMENTANFASDNAGSAVMLIGCLIVFAFYYWAWHHFGRDPEKGAIIPRYKPPADISPAAARFIMRMGFDQKAFAAALINTAVKGALTIDEEGKHFKLLHNETASKRDLSPGERAIVGNYFSGYRAGSTLTLKQSNHREIREGIESLKDHLEEEYELAYFKTNQRYMYIGLGITAAIVLIGALLSPSAPILLFMSVWLSIWTTGVMALGKQVWHKWRSVFLGHGNRAFSIPSAVFISAFATPFFAGEAFGIFMVVANSSLMFVFCLLLFAGLNTVFIYLLKAPTKLGRRVMDDIEGFKMYLGVTEKDRLDMFTPPHKTPELFEAYLPYAIALDVENEWGEQFAGVLDSAVASGQGEGAYQPHWYRGNSWQRFGSSGFANAVGSSLSSSVASSSTAPGSSSGSSGGGSSGGGGGGGGGGGW